MSAELAHMLSAGYAAKLIAQGRQAAKKPIKVSLFGASVMDMTHEELAGKLAGSEHDFEVVNDSTSGDKSSDGLKKLDRIAASDADIVVISFGGNDVRHGHTLEEVKENLSTIVNTLHDKGKEVLLIGINPLDLKHFFEETDKPESEICESEHDPFIQQVLDLFEGLSDQLNIRGFKKSLFSGFERADFQDDGFHPNEQGVSIIADDLDKHLHEIAPHVLAKRRLQASQSNEKGIQR